MLRNKTQVVSVGGVLMGGDNPVRIQSMTNTRTEDADATVKQILRLEEAGCELVRCTVPTPEAALAIKLEATADEIIGTIHCHPTVSEALSECVMAAEGRAIHIPNKKK